MTRFSTTAAALILASGVVFAQTGTQTAGQTAPPKPAPATPQTPAAAPKAAPVPFPADAKIAYVSVQNIIAESKVGKCGAVQMKALTDKDQAAVVAKQKEIAAQQQKMQAQQSLVSEAVLTQMGRELEKMQRDLQALATDNQSREGELNQDLVNAFQTKVSPIFEALRVEKSLWMVMAVDQAPGAIVAANLGLDLSAEVTKRLDAAFPDPCKSN